MLLCSVTHNLKPEYEQGVERTLDDAKKKKKKKKKKKYIWVIFKIKIRGEHLIIAIHHGKKNQASSLPFSWLSRFIPIYIPPSSLEDHKAVVSGTGCVCSGVGLLTPHGGPGDRGWSDLPYRQPVPVWLNMPV